MSNLQLPCLYVNVIEGVSLVTDKNGKLSDPYAIIKFEDKEYLTSAIHKTLNPQWQEEFFMNIKNLNSTIVIQVWDKDLLFDSFMGEMKLNVHDLINDNERAVDKLYRLEQRTPKDKVEGSIRLRMHCMLTQKGETEAALEVIDPALYKSVEAFFSDKDQNHTFELLEELTLHLASGDAALKGIVTLYDLNGKLFPILIEAMKQEIEATDHAQSIFRRNSLASKLAITYMYTRGSRFLESTLKALIQNWCAKPPIVEINPQLMVPGTDSDSCAEALRSTTQHLLDTILSHGENCPVHVQALLKVFHDAVSRKFSDIGHLPVISFLFLRFFCPAILSPESFNLIDKAPSEAAQRTLKLVVKLLQNTANDVEFGKKEEYMTRMNDFVHENAQKIKDFIAQLLDKINSVQIPPPGIDDDLAEKEKLLAFYEIHKFVDEHMASKPDNIGDGMRKLDETLKLVGPLPTFHSSRKKGSNAKTEPRRRKSIFSRK